MSLQEQESSTEYAFAGVADYPSYIETIFAIKRKFRMAKENGAEALLSDAAGSRGSASS